MLNIGWATRDITPTGPVMIQGQMHRRISTGVMDPLTVTAMIVTGDDPEHNTAFVSCDIAFPSDNMYREIREQLVHRVPDLPPGNVILNATHTHTSMVFEDGSYELPKGDVWSPSKCREWINVRILDAIEEAWANRSEHRLARAYGHAVVGHNRHAVYRDGHAQMYGEINTEDFDHFGGYVDHSVDMLFTWDEQERLTGVALSIPCPSQVDEGLCVLSADYWHEIRVELRKRFGDPLQILALCGVAGDQSPHFLLYKKEEELMRVRHGNSERQEIALRVADAVSRALPVSAPEDDWGLTHVSETVVLPARKITQQERDWAETASKEAKVKWEGKHGWWPERLQRVVDTFDGRIAPEPCPTEIHVVRLGDMVIATNPFELFLDYGLRIKARSCAEQTMLVQLTGRGFYLPSARAVAGGGYGAMPAVSAVGPEGGKMLVAKTLALVDVT